MSLIFPKKPLYAPMLGTLGGGSARGMGRGIGGKKIPYNPFVISWEAGRGSGAIYAYSPEAAIEGYTSTFELVDAPAVTVVANQYTSIAVSSYRNDVYISDDGYGTLLDLSWDGTTLSATRQTNSNYGYTGGYNYGSAWYGRTHFGNARGTNSQPYTIQYSNSLSSGGWLNYSNLGPVSNAASEDAAFRLGKWQFFIGYNSIEVWDLSIAPYYPSTTNHFRSWQKTDHGIVISPRDNMIGLLDANSTTGLFWDYDTGNSYSINHGMNNSWFYGDSGGCYLWMYALTPSESFSGSFNRSNYHIVASGYNGSGVASSTDANSYTNSNYFWRGGTYNAETQKMYLVGMTSDGTNARAIEQTNSMTGSSQGTSMNQNIYLRNRGPFRGDMFSHKLEDHQIFNRNYY